MLELKTKNTQQYVDSGLICESCKTVIDRTAPGHKRRCKHHQEAA